MKKHLILLSAFTAIVLATSPSFASNPFGTPAAPAPSSIDIYDWYNLGEMIAAASEYSFNVSIYEQMDDTYKQIYDLMVKAHLSDGTINAFKQWYPVIRSLPWDKDWQTWTKEQQAAWQKSALSAAWLKGVGQDASKAVESVFFYWLGHHAILLAWAVPYYQSGNWADGVKNVISYASTDFLDFSTNPNYSGVFGALTPDVQSAITFVGSLKKKLSPNTNPFDKNPQGGLTSDDVAKAVDAGKAIRAAAQANQLTK